MRKPLIFLLLLAVFSSCTDFREKLMYEFPPYHLVNPQTIESHLPVVNIEVSQVQYDYMYENFEADINIYGTFSIYRNQELVFEAENTRFGIKGGASRYYDLKSIGIRFEEPQYNEGRNIINSGELLPLHSIDLLESIRLRNSGNDFNISRNATMIKDISYTRMAIEAGLNLDLMYAEQAVVFLNNHFLGVMNLRTESTARGISRKYNTTRDQVSLMKVSPNQEGGIDIEIQNGRYHKINTFLEAIENQNMNFLLNEVDIPNFIDYIVFNTFIANRDWPDNNVKIFAIGDGLFRFFMFDLDHSNLSHKTREPLSFLERVRKNPVSDLFFILYENEEFRTAFYKRYVELLQSGVFHPEIFTEITTHHYKNIENVMPFHIERYRQPAAMAEWYRNIELLNVQFQQRAKYMEELMIEQ